MIGVVDWGMLGKPVTVVAQLTLHVYTSNAVIWVIMCNIFGSGSLISADLTVVINRPSVIVSEVSRPEQSKNTHT